MPPIPGTGKRFALPLETKIKIIEEVDKGRLSKSEVAKVFKIPKSTLFTILKNRATISKVCASAVAPDRIRARDAKYPKLEQALIEWIKCMRAKNIPVDGNVLKTKAETFALRMNIDQTFKASDGWLNRFKLRNGLSFKKVCGESAAVNMDTVKEWREGRLKRIIADYDPNDVFNADETALFYKLLPDRTLIFKNETCSGGKRSKERLTALLATNMTGTNKLKLLVIGKSQKPRCFKGINSLPTIYKANSKAWMNGTIFEEWVRDLERSMSQMGQKILLIIDNCTAHPKIEGLKAVKVEFLPPNVTSVLQPLDQGIIQSFKKNYRKMLLNRIVLCQENGKSYEIDILGALHLAAASWKAVSENTIANCFRHAGFVKSQDAALQLAETEQAPPPSSPLPAEENEGETLFEKLRELAHLPDDTNFEDYAAVDYNVECSEDLSEDQMIDMIINNTKHSDEVSSDDEEDNAEAPPKPKTSIKQASEALQIIRNFYEREENAEDRLAMIMDIENDVLTRARSQLKQSNITAFFRK